MSTKLNAEARPPMVHELKCHPGPFQAVKNGSKPFEWRKDDRLPPDDFRVGDTLWLREWDPKHNALHYDIDVTYFPIGYTGDEIRRTVTYIIREGFGIPEGYCIMGLAQPLSDERDEYREALERLTTVSEVLTISTNPFSPCVTGVIIHDRKRVSEEVANARTILAKHKRP